MSALCRGCQRCGTYMATTRYRKKDLCDGCATAERSDAQRAAAGSAVPKCRLRGGVPAELADIAPHWYNWLLRCTSWGRAIEKPAHVQKIPPPPECEPAVPRTLLDMSQSAYCIVGEAHGWDGAYSHIARLPGTGPHYTDDGCVYCFGYSMLFLRTDGRRWLAPFCRHWASEHSPGGPGT